MGRLADKVVIVTGAASGIGKATAQRLAAEGARLVLGDVNVEGAQATADLLRERNDHVVAGFDAGNAASCRAFIAEAAEKAGRIDMLCNIAGIMDWAPLDKAPDAVDLFHHVAIIAADHRLQRQRVGLLEHHDIGTDDRPLRPFRSSRC